MSVLKISRRSEMIKKLIMVIVIGSISFQINSMKRSLEETNVTENPLKKIKIEENKQRRSLFSFFNANDMAGFRAEAEWRKSYDKDSLNEKDASGQTILFIADGCKKRKSGEYFKILIENGADVNSRNVTTGMTVLSSAAMDLDFKRMKRALEAGVDPNICTVDGVLPLSYLSANDDIKSDPQKLEVLDILCAKTDLTRRTADGSNIMHSRLLKRPVAERLLLHGGDIDVLNAREHKPKDTCRVSETCELLISREAVRDQVVMPAMRQIVQQSQDFKNRDNFPYMQHSVPKLIFNREAIGPKDLNSNRLRFVGK